MKLRFIFIIVLLVILVSLAAVEGKKKKKGCVLNKKIYKAGRVAYKDRKHCLKLKCVKVKKGKKVKYTLKAKTYRGCQCFPKLCRGPRCSPVACPMCTQEWEPVCGSNNVTYTNECMLETSVAPCGPDEAKLMHYGECGDCPIGCPKNRDPVCGSDGVTYDNHCVLLTKACETNSSLSMVNEGPCVALTNRTGSISKCDKCPKIKKPVCGSNGITYSNKCLLEAAVCKGENVTMAYDGECEKTIEESAQPRKPCKYNGKKYNSGDIIQDMVDYCLTAVCQPSRNPRKSKVVFQDFQGALNCECTSNRLRRHILRISGE